MKKFLKILTIICVTVSIVSIGFISYQAYDLSAYNIEKISKLYRKINDFIRLQKEMNKLQIQSVQDIRVDLLKYMIKQNEFNIEILRWTAEPNLAYLRLTTVEIKVGNYGGTGTIIGVDQNYLYILTAKHMFQDKGEIDILVTEIETKKFVKIISVSRENIYNDENIDIALIKVERPKGKFLALPISVNMPLIGTKIYTIGHPFNLHYSVNKGIITNYVERIFDNKKGKYMMISAPSYGGSSGGAVINKYTELVGMVVGVIYIKEGRTKIKYHQLGIAVKLKDIRKFVAYVIEKERIKYEEENNN